ncbi:mandelate racemase/muconate lactonizing enzyme family protein [Candidatus Epulonipiscium viviparus]|uniref:mandelate racemase/muconate lactonizing enzyme family protein n=1 Tax=Candidatus Epulonipiscium viviparus TaxID=420336 RepID=UPI002738058C|nr:mandelate racemase/muconate lactonizing enzyme family protein [Candidatus Epulopiscium viviparus]
MKIKDVYVHKISAKLEVPFKFSQGWVDKRSSVIVEVVDDNGNAGFGECLCHGQQSPHLAAAFIEHCYKEEVIGKDPFDSEVIWETLYNKSRPFGQLGIAVNALSGLDIAIWDLKGKILGMPVSKLLGGTFRNKLLAYATGFYRKADGVYPQDAVEEALKYKELGFKGMKLKVGFTPEKDIEYIRAVRKAVGHDIMLMADFNAAYSQADARKIILELEPEKIYFYEEPISPEDMEGYKAIRNLTSSFIAAGEEIFGKISIKNWLSAGALDIYQPDVCSSGGFTECKKMAAIAGAYNTTIMPHAWGSGVGLAAALHFIASLPNTPMSYEPSEIFLEFDQSDHPFRKELINDTIKYEDGYIYVPDKPGLGIEINREILTKYQV